MKRKSIIFIVTLLVIIIALNIFKNEKVEEIERKKVITVSILPQRYFVKKIVGEDYKINVMLPPGASPAAYDPTPKQLRELTDSIIYFRIGYIPFEKNYIEKFRNLNPRMKIIDLSNGVDLIKKGKAIDPHIWLSPKMVKIEVENIMKAMVLLNPQKSEEYKKNYIKFKKDLEELDEKITRELRDLKSNNFLVYHPSWTYFARDCNLNQIAIEVDGKEPTPKNIKDIIDLAKKEEIKMIIVQKQMSIQSAEMIAQEINGEVIQLDPLAENWYENMNKISETFGEKIIN